MHTDITEIVNMDRPIRNIMCANDCPCMKSRQMYFASRILLLVMTVCKRNVLSIHKEWHHLENVYIPVKSKAICKKHN